MQRDVHDVWPVIEDALYAIPCKTARDRHSRHYGFTGPTCREDFPGCPSLCCLCMTPGKTGTANGQVCNIIHHIPASPFCPSAAVAISDRRQLQDSVLEPQGEQAKQIILKSGECSDATAPGVPRCTSQSRTKTMC